MGARAEPIPLSDEDRAILALESPTIAGHTMKVLVLEPPAIGAAELRAALASRLGEAPELTYALAETGGRPAWEPRPAPEVAGQIVAHGGGPVEEARITELAAALFAQRLDRDRPLWRLDVVATAGGGTALVWRIHHALADGTAAVRIARAALFDPEAGGPGPAERRRARSEDDRRRRRHLVRALERELGRARSPSPFDAAVGSSRAIRFAEAPLGALHEAAKGRAGATVNDAVLACVAGALRRWLELHERRLDELRVKVPVSLHHEGDHAANRDSYFTVPLPLAEPDPIARLRAVRAATAERKADLDAQEIAALHRDLSLASPRLERLAERLERSSRRFALNVSNVPGPRRAVTILSSAVRSLHTIAEIGERHALRIAVLSYADRLRFGLCADPAVVDDLGLIAAGIEREAGLLTTPA